VTRIGDPSVTPVQRRESATNKKLQRLAGEFNLFETGGFAIVFCVYVSWNMEGLVVCRIKYL